jgi:hypothetical protein
LTELNAKVGMGMMAKQSSRVRKSRGAGRALCAAVLAALSLPAGASATVFSFGTINPTDVITSLTFAPASTKTSFCVTGPCANQMHVEAYLSQINFSNRPNITGIAPNSVLLTSDINLLSLTVNPAAGSNPSGYSATFTNGMVDLSIVDVLGGWLTVLDTDYIGTLDHSAVEAGPGPITGELTADLDILVTSDADFRSAFGVLGSMDANFSGFFSDGVTVGSNMCNLVKADATIYPNFPASQNCAGGYALDDFTTNAVITVIPVPEPGTALLLGLGLVGVAALKRK